MTRRVSSLNSVSVGITRDIGSDFDVVKSVADKMDNILAAEVYAATATTKAADTAAIYNNFDSRYLGVKTSDPLVDNLGNPLQEGALYFNSVEDQMLVYEGSSWVVVGKTRYTASATEPTNPPPEPGDEWLDTTNEILYRYLSDGTNTAWVSLIKSERLFVGSV